MLVHVSTAYTNIDRSPVEERVYQPTDDWRDVIRWAEQLSDQEVIDLLGPKSVTLCPIVRNRIPNSQKWTSKFNDGHDLHA